MSWAEVKTAINSTLGTSDFKPLDEIVIEGQKNKTLTASKDNVIFGLIDELDYETVSHTHSTVFKTRFEMGGSVWVHFIWKVTEDYSDVPVEDCVISVLKNGVEYREFYAAKDSDGSVYDEEWKKIFVDEGDVVSFYCNGIGDTMIITKLELCGTVTDTCVSAGSFKQEHIFYDKGTVYKTETADPLLERGGTIQYIRKNVGGFEITTLGGLTVPEITGPQVVVPESVKNLSARVFGTTVERVRFLGVPDSISIVAFEYAWACTEIYVPWNEDDPINEGAPWGAEKATIYYGYTADKSL